MIRPLVAIFLLLLTATVGCTRVSAGDPSPEGPKTNSTRDQPTSATSAPATRPREIRLDNVDPCTLLPEAAWPDYSLDKPGEPSTDDKGAATCEWYADSGYMDVNLVTYEGVEAQEGRLGQIEPTDPINDFPTYTITLPDDDDACFIAVDVAEGQYLDIQVALYKATRDITAICDYAHKFATSIMSTLVQAR
jgi:hypothetical protein